ncbi:MAG: hypothetical protein KGI54_15945 [Pseudomonadota bacterium]|nr:hypothetical protein [Pseudomonadota bacterium]
MSVAVALDQFCNAILGGDPAETISSRAAKARNEGKQWGCILCKVLSIIIQKNHCTKSLDANVGSNSIIPD